MGTNTVFSKLYLSLAVVAFGVLAGCKSPEIEFQADTLTVDAGQPVTLTTTITSQMANLKAIKGSAIFRVERNYRLIDEDPLASGKEFDTGCVSGVILDWDCVAAPLTPAAMVRRPPRDTTFTIKAVDTLSLAYVKDLKPYTSKKSLSVTVNRDVAPDSNLVNSTNFPDEYFRQCVEDAVSLNGYSSVSEITSLSCTGDSTASITTRIRSLKGIQFLYALTDVDLSGGYLLDELYDLYWLDNLETLNIADTSATSNNGGQGTCLYQERVAEYFGVDVAITMSGHCPD
jgi:hypothetical protein